MKYKKKHYFLQISSAPSVLHSSRQSASWSNNLIKDRNERRATSMTTTRYVKKTSSRQYSYFIHTRERRRTPTVAVTAEEYRERRGMGRSNRKSGEDFHLCEYLSSFDCQGNISLQKLSEDSSKNWNLQHFDHPHDCLRDLYCKHINSNLMIASLYVICMF